ncbi:MAG: pilin [Patescibacteria group bacterium]|nr:pilin [Patescibacteria group bacterium]
MTINPVKYLKALRNLTELFAFAAICFFTFNAISVKSVQALSCGCQSADSCDSIGGNIWNDSMLTQSSPPSGLVACCYQGSCAYISSDKCDAALGTVASPAYACKGGLVRCCTGNVENSNTGGTNSADDWAGKDGTVKTDATGSQPKVVVDNYDGSSCKVPGTNFSFPCPLGGGQEKLPQIFGRIIRWSLGLVGALFFAMFIYGGFMYIVAGGSSKNAETGQKTLVNAVIGLTIVIFSYMIVTWVVETFMAGLG